MTTPRKNDIIGANKERNKTMQKWRVIYRTKTDGDSCSVWVCAENKERAKDVARREYWDIQSIIAVEKL